MGMNTLEIYKALANEIRLNIMEWLKEPEKHFPPQGLHLPDGSTWTGGVCVGSIQEKAGISQSTVSHYLDIHQRYDTISCVHCRSLGDSLKQAISNGCRP